MLIRNKLSSTQIAILPSVIRKFWAENNTSYDPEVTIQTSLNNVLYGINGTAKHDTWVNEDATVYCACRVEIDADGKSVYSATHLWIHPSKRGIRNVRRIIRFLRFYAQKQGHKRFYVLSSRTDSIKAYARGLGKRFKINTVTFSEEF